jgi:hypothetical protein
VHASLAQQPSHIPAPFPITIADQHLMITQHAIASGERAADLVREQIIRMRGRSHNLDTP